MVNFVNRICSAVLVENVLEVCAVQRSVSLLLTELGVPTWESQVGTFHKTNQSEAIKEIGYR